MTAAADMLAQCIAAPADDAPRLVWADAIGGERGELVVLQCDLARGGLAPAEVAARRRRERELLARHGAAWSGIAHLATGWSFQRGFVEAARIEVDVLAREAGALFEAAPLVSSLAIAGLAGRIDPATRRIARPRPAAEALGLLAGVLALPAMKRLRGLDVIEPAGWVDTVRYRHGIVPLADDVAALLAGYGSLESLRGLGIAGGALGPRGLEALGALAEHASLERLWLRGQRLSVPDVAVLLQRFPGIDVLDLSGPVLAIEELAPLLDRPLVSLAVTGITPAGIAALARSRAASTLEHLALLDLAPGTAASLEAFPVLRSLELSSGPRVIEELPSRPLPALRELAIRSPIAPLRLAILATTLGGGLDLLDLRGSFTRLADRPAIMGEVLVDEVAQPALLHPTARVMLAAARSTPNELRGDLPPPAYLVGLDRGVAGWVWEVPAEDHVSIGRAATNQLVIANTAHAHAHLRWDASSGGHAILADSDVFVGARQVHAHELVDGLVFRLGAVSLRYFAGDGARARASAESAARMP